jgi:hypothetical protein
MSRAKHQTIPTAALAWILGENVGNSSKAIFAHMVGQKAPYRGWSHPYDPADLRRCLILLQKVPEWGLRLPEMAKRSKEWKALVSRWSELNASLEDEVGLDLSKGREAPKTYALMKEVLDGARLAKAA